MKKAIGLLSLFSILLLVVGCGGDINKVKNGYLDFDKSITVEQALNGYGYTKKVNWKEFKTENGRKYVEAELVLDYQKTRLYTERFTWLVETEDGTEQTNKIQKADVRITFIFVINNDDTFKIEGAYFSGTDTWGDAFEKPSIIKHIPSIINTLEMIYGNYEIPNITK